MERAREKWATHNYYARPVEVTLQLRTAGVVFNRRSVPASVIRVACSRIAPSSSAGCRTQSPTPSAPASCASCPRANAISTSTRASERCCSAESKRSAACVGGRCVLVRGPLSVARRMTALSVHPLLFTAGSGFKMAQEQSAFSIPPI